MNRRDFFGRVLAGGAVAAVAKPTAAPEHGLPREVVEDYLCFLRTGRWSHEQIVDAMMQELPRQFARNRHGLRDAFTAIARQT
jgi:hypothetical protein